LFDGPALQPSLQATIDTPDSEWTAGAWGNVGLSDAEGERGDLTEVDAWVERTAPVGGASLSLGLYQYGYPATGRRSTGEVHAAISAENELVSPALHLWYDYQEADGVYASAELSHTLFRAAAWQAGLVLSAGWMSTGEAERYFGVDEPGFSDVTGSA